MVNDFLKNIEKCQLLRHDQKLFVAVSAGIDSMVLADLLLKTGIDMGFAHCNFGLRNNESDADERFVYDTAIKLNLPIYIKKFDVNQYASDNKLSIQMAARELRYGWFDELIETTDYELYATAHHFDDQMETFFINLMRGTGINGLKGIPVKNGNCIRPLLFADRNMIAEYARTNNVKFREDSSNKSDKYLRNRIRHLVLPSLEKTRENYKTGFDNTFSILQYASRFISGQIKIIEEELLQKYVDHFTIDINKLMQIDEPAFVLFEIIKNQNFNFSTVKNIVSGINKNPGKQFFSPTHELIIDRDKLIVCEIKDEEAIKLDIEEHVTEISQPIEMQISKFHYSGQQIPNNSNIAWLDFNKLEFPLQIRKHREGDSFAPLGMEGSKKLSDFFIDEKLSILKKRNTYVLVSQDKIAWVIGHRIDNRFKITDNTTDVYAMEIIFKPI
jgi:tRNA(Ile)-lysidine synthase